MKITNYTIPATINKEITIALVADLHDRPFEQIKQAFSRRKPDIIAIAGDLINGNTVNSVNGLNFLRYAADISTTVYSLGNHERIFKSEDIAAVSKTGVTILDNAAIQFNGINIGGLTSGFHNSRQSALYKTPQPDIVWLDRFSHLQGYKLLICHHPEYYEPYIKPLDIDLTLSGHAHGGQIRIFGQGLFAPGQGMIPKYTSGVYDNRLVVSRGLANTSGYIPRLWNETELVYIMLSPA